VTATTTDPTPGNNSAQASTTVQAPNCTLRPRVVVQTQVVTVAGVARIRATISTQTSAQVPVNTFTSIQFTHVNDAIVTVLPSGPANQDAPFTHTLPGGATQVQFDVFREPGKTHPTARFIANDVCGGWNSLVGAGPSVPI
jgi:hypothetical protein